VAPPPWLESLRAVSPPWSVSLLAQVAAVRTLQCPAYYEARWQETHALREALAEVLATLGFDVVPSVTSFLLCHIPESAPDTTTLLRHCEAEGLFLRDVSNMGHGFGGRALRIAVKDPTTNWRMIDILDQSLRPD
jgi:histidinol-phosphate/aromatic aminotransferase/cobyric acid decarboxylase-like protein